MTQPPSPQNRIKVLIVDDSEVTRMLLRHLLNADPVMQVIQAVGDGLAAIDYLAFAEIKPDVMVIDIHMPKMDGFEATRHIMENWPLPIVICSAASDPREMAVTFRAMEAGAVACVEKPVATGDDFHPRCRNLLETVRLMSEVKVIRRWRKPLTPAARSFTAVGATPAHARVSVVGIGASTGGPPVLQTILAALPRDLPVPLLIVQHISPGFLAAMVEWLNHSAALRVRIATHGAQALPGHAYIAPDDFHLGYGAGGQLLLSKAAEENGLRPAVSWLFRSLAPLGPATVGVLLTGMGKDGAAELKLMRDRGACTIAQDRESSVVHGMPGEAIALGGASQTLSADRIAGALAGLVNRRNLAAGAWS